MARRTPVSDTKDLWLLIKGEIGGVVFWRAIARFIKPGTWKGKALKLHSKAHMYLIPAKAVHVAPGYILNAYAMWIQNPRIVYWPGEELTIINGENSFEATLENYFGKTVIKVV